MKPRISRLLGAGGEIVLRIGPTHAKAAENRIDNLPLALLIGSGDFNLTSLGPRMT